MKEGEAGFHKRKKAHTWQSGSKNGKLERLSPATQLPKLSHKHVKISCPECASQKLWKDGLRYTKQGEVQRYLCRACGYRFSELKIKLNVSTQSLKTLNPEPNLLNTDIAKGNFAIKKRFDPLSLQRREYVASHVSSKETIIGKALNTFGDYNRNYQVCATEKEAKNLAETQGKTRQKWAAGATKPTNAEIKGKIVEFAWWMKKEGYAESTIKLYTTIIRCLFNRNVDVFNPEAMKEYMAKENLKGKWKHTVISAYSLLLKKHGIQWQPPKCYFTRKLPFIPTEKEIDHLIAGCGKKTATFLQLLKETGMRAGEANSLEWTDIDFERKTITLNKPEKNNNPRIFNVSNKLIAMLNLLPKKSTRIFSSMLAAKQVTLHYSRKRIAKKLQNPRLLRIKFHTLRHWKATMLYHQTKDILYVKQFLGHKRIDTTLLYIQLEEALFKQQTDEFTVKVAKNPEEIKSLLEVGFEYICEKDDLLYFRKRK